MHVQQLLHGQASCCSSAAGCSWVGMMAQAGPPVAAVTCASLLPACGAFALAYRMSALAVDSSSSKVNSCMLVSVAVISWSSVRGAPCVHSLCLRCYRQTVLTGWEGVTALKMVLQCCSSSLLCQQAACACAQGTCQELLPLHVTRGSLQYHHSSQHTAVTMGMLQRAGEGLVPSAAVLVPRRQ